MPIYDYRCGACGRREDVRQDFAAAPLTDCPGCGAAGSYGRVPQAPAVLISRQGGRTPLAPPPSTRRRPPGPHPHGAGGRRLVAPYVTHERDGSETVYRSEGEAYRGELDRTGSAQLAARNLEHIRRLGYVDGTRSAAFREAVRGLAPGDVAR